MPTNELASNSLAALTTTYNERVVKANENKVPGTWTPVKRFKNKADALARIEKVTAATTEALALEPCTQGKETRTRIPRTGTITILVAANPKKEGTKAYSRYALYEDGMPVQAALEAGVTAEDLRWDVQHKYVEIK